MGDPSLFARTEIVPARFGNGEMSSKVLQNAKLFFNKYLEEIFTVTKRIPRRPPVYKIADYHGEELEGTFYKQELQNIIKKDSDFCGIENVIKSRMRGKHREYLVKWLGYSNDFNSWVPEDNVKDISK